MLPLFSQLLPTPKPPVLNNRRRILCPVLQLRNHVPKPLIRFTFEPTHSSVVRSNITNSRALHAWNGTRLVLDVIFCVAEVCFVLSPVEYYENSGHQGNELVGDVLERLGFDFEGFDKAGFRLNELSRSKGYGFFETC
jgi:hypothetical protein